MNIKLFRLVPVIGISILSATVLTFSTMVTTTSNYLQTLLTTHQDGITRGVPIG